MDTNKGLAAVPDSDLIFLLFRARQSIYRIIDKEVARYGVTLEQATVMRLIKAKSDISIDDICRMMIREHHTISSLITRMVKKNLVHVKKGSRGRISLILSEQGLEILDKIDAEDSRGDLMSVLNGEEKQRLALYLQKIARHALSKANLEETYFVPGGFAPDNTSR